MPYPLARIREVGLNPLPAWAGTSCEWKKKNARRGGRSAGVLLFSNAGPGRRVVRRTVRAERGRRFAPTEFLLV